MDRDVNIDILRKEAISVLNKAERFVSEGSLGKACLEYKQTVLRAEEIFPDKLRLDDVERKAVEFIEGVEKDFKLKIITK